MRQVRMDDGVRLATWTTGEPSALPAVLLVHGGPGMWDYLEPVAAMIDDLSVVHRFDQRGCGDSDPSEVPSLERSMADIEGLRTAWGYSSWVVIGHSFGASLAFEYAARFPSRTRAMVTSPGRGRRLEDGVPRRTEAPDDRVPDRTAGTAVVAV